MAVKRVRITHNMGCPSRRPHWEEEEVRVSAAHVHSFTPSVLLILTPSLYACMRRRRRRGGGGSISSGHALIRMYSMSADITSSVPLLQYS